MLRSVCDPADRPPTSASKAAAYQSDQRTASERVRKLTSAPMSDEPSAEERAKTTLFARVPQGNVR
jgi:hypothetical protein